MAKLTPMRAIRAKCLDCCCGQVVEVRLCAAENCPLWENRMVIGRKRINRSKKMRKSKNRKLGPCFLMRGGLKQ